MLALVLVLILSASAFAQDAVEKGRKIYQQSGCVACHKIKGEGSPVAPDLTRVGVTRTEPAWYRKFLRDPASVNPASRMPPYGDLSNEEMEALISYLLTLK